MRSTNYVRKNINIKLFEGVNSTISENILPLSYSPLSYNFTFDGGALGNKMGIESAKTTILATPEGRHLLPSLPDDLSVKSVHLYRKFDFNNNIRDDKLIVRANDDTYYYTSLFSVDTFHKITNLTATGKDCSVCYRYNNEDVFLLSSEKGLFHIYNGETVTTIVDAPKMTSMCIHYERVFATVTGEKNSVWFSADFNPSNWKVSGSEAGFINFDDDGGAVLRVVPFLDHIYIFREYEIIRLTAYGEQKEFSISKLYTASGRIYPDTIALCGDRIIFMAEDGLYYLDGYTIHPLAKSLTKFFPIKKSNAVGCYLNGKYYLAIKLNFGVDNINKILCEKGFHENNCLVVFDIRKNNFAIMRGVDIHSLCSIKIHHESSVLATFNFEHNKKIGRVVENGKAFDDLLPSYWTSSTTDLGYPSRVKTIREVSFMTDVSCILGVDIDGEIVEYTVDGQGSKTKRIIVNKSGNTVRIFIKALTYAVQISAPTITVDIVWGILWTITLRTYYYQLKLLKNGYTN